MLATQVIEIVVAGTAPTTGSGTKNIYNVFHYRLMSGVMGNMGQILGQFDTLVWSFVAAQLSADYTGVSLKGRLLDDATVQYFTSAGAPASGSIALPRLPTDTAVVLPLQGSQRGKNWRGSKHFGPIPTASVTKDELTSGAATAWQAVAAKLLTTFIDGVTSGVYGPVVLSRSLSQTRVNPTSIQVSDVTAVLVNKTIGTMRKRKEKTVR